MTGKLPQSGAFSVEYKGGRLTLAARDAPLADVSRAIGERAGFETLIVGQVEEQVSLSLRDQPLVPALNQIFGRSNRVIVYAPHEGSRAIDDRRIVRIWLLGSGISQGVSAGAITSTVPTDVPRADDAKKRSEDLLRMGNGPATDAELDALAQALQNDESALVRSRAAIALGALKDPRAVPALEMAIRDPSSTVRAQALSALGQIGGARAISALGDVLLYGSDGRDRVIAARALASQDVDAARQYLDAVADDADQQVREASHARSKGARGSASNGSAPIQLGPELTQ